MCPAHRPRQLRGSSLRGRSGVVLVLLIELVVLCQAQNSGLVDCAWELASSAPQKCMEGGYSSDAFQHLLYIGAVQCANDRPRALVVRTCVPEYLAPPVRAAVSTLFEAGPASWLDGQKLPEVQSQVVSDTTPGCQVASAPYPSFPPASTLPLEATRHGVITTAALAYGSLVPAGALLDLSALAVVDRSLDWADVLLPLRHKLTNSHEGILPMMPLDGSVLLLIYRRDVFEAMNEQVPETWNDLAGFVESYDKSRPPWAPPFALCATPEPSCGGSSLFNAIWHSMAQSLTLGQGVYFNPETMQPLVRTAAFAEAARLFARIWRRALPQQAGQCGYTHTALQQGNCTVVIGTFEQVKAVASSASTSSSVAAGGMGLDFALPTASVRPSDFAVAQLPGSPYVLDPTNYDNLVLCTFQNCPYGEVTKRQLISGRAPARLMNVAQPPEGQQELQQMYVVNRAPFVPSSMLVGVINSRSSTSEQLLAWHTLSYIASPNVSLGLVLARGTNVAPFRMSHFSGDARSKWTAEGYDANLVNEGLDALHDAQWHCNLAWGLHMVDGAFYGSAVSAFLAWLLSSSNPSLPTDDLLAAEIDKLQTNLIDHYSPSAAFAQQYSDFLNLGSHTDAGAEQPLPLDKVDSNDNSRVVALAVALVVAGLAALVVGGYLVYRFGCGSLRWRRGQSVCTDAPAVSPFTTLLITDIEGSTRLWEELPEVIMGCALGLHHACLRRVLIRHRGYESATEGDSFVLAFHRPDAALAFAVEAQQELLEQEWPAALLENEVCAPVYTCVPTGFPFKRPPALEGVFSRMSIRPHSNTSAAATPSAQHGSLARITSFGRNRAAMAQSPTLSQGQLRSSAGPWQRASIDMGLFNSLNKKGNPPASKGFSILTYMGASSSLVPPSPAAQDLAATGSVVSTLPASPGSRSSRPSECRDAPSPSSTPAPPYGHHEVVDLFQRASRAQVPLPADPCSAQQQLTPRKPGELSRKLQELQNQQLLVSHQQQLFDDPSVPCSSVASSGRWAIIHAGETAMLLEDQSGAATASSKRCDAPEYVSVPSVALPTASTSRNATGSGMAPIGDAANSTTGVTELADGAGGSEPLPKISLPLGRSRATRRMAPSVPTRSAGMPVASHSPLVTAGNTEGAYGTAGASAWEVCTLDESLKATMRSFDDGGTVDRKRRLLWRGLRVRMGLHSGITSESELTHNRASARVVYSGDCASIVRVVADSAQGGMVLLSESFLDALELQGPADGLHGAAAEAMLFNIGRYRIRHKDMTSLLYLATTADLAPRAAVAPPPRNISAVGLSVYSAPVGRVALAALNVPDVAALQEWDAATTDQALTAMRGVLLEQLSSHRGYLVSMDCEQGNMTAAFAFPLDAVRWALSCRDMLSSVVDWPANLMEHELCREGELTAYPLATGPPSARVGGNSTAALHGVGSGSGPLPSPVLGRGPPRASLELSHALTASCDNAPFWTAATSGASASASVASKGGADDSFCGARFAYVTGGGSSQPLCRVQRAGSRSVEMDAAPPMGVSAGGGGGGAASSGGAVARGGSLTVRSSGAGRLGSNQWNNSKKRLQTAQSQGALEGGSQPGAVGSIQAADAGAAAAAPPKPPGGFSSKVACLSARFWASAGGYLEAPPAAVAGSTAAGTSCQGLSARRLTSAAVTFPSHALSGAVQPQGPCTTSGGLSPRDGVVEGQSSGCASPEPPKGLTVKTALAWEHSDEADTEDGGDGGDIFSVHLGGMDGCGPFTRQQGVSMSGGCTVHSQAAGATAGSAGEAERSAAVVVLRGPRIRVGIECGTVEWGISTLHSLSYSGAPAVMAEKLASVAAPGQVLATCGVMWEMHRMQASIVIAAEPGDEVVVRAEADSDGGFHTAGTFRGPAVVGTPLQPGSGRAGLTIARHRRQQVFACRFTLDWDEALREYDLLSAQQTGPLTHAHSGGGWSSPLAARLSPFSSPWSWSTVARMRTKRPLGNAPGAVVPDSRRSMCSRRSFEAFARVSSPLTMMPHAKGAPPQPQAGSVSSSVPCAATAPPLPLSRSHPLSGMHAGPAPSPSRANLDGRQLSGSRRVFASAGPLSTTTGFQQQLLLQHNKAIVGFGHGRGSPRQTSRAGNPYAISVSAPSNVLQQAPPAPPAAATFFAASAAPASCAQCSPRFAPRQVAHAEAPGAELAFAHSAKTQALRDNNNTEDSFSLSLRYQVAKATSSTSRKITTGSIASPRSDSTFGHSRDASTPVLAVMAELHVRVSPQSPFVSSRESGFASGVVGALTPATAGALSPTAAGGDAGGVSVGSLLAFSLRSGGAYWSSGMASSGGAAGSGASGKLQQALKQHRSYARRQMQQNDRLQQQTLQRGVMQQSSLAEGRQAVLWKDAEAPGAVQPLSNGRQSHAASPEVQDSSPSAVAPEALCGSPRSSTHRGRTAAQHRWPLGFTAPASPSVVAGQSRSVPQDRGQRRAQAPALALSARAATLDAGGSGDSRRTCSTWPTEVTAAAQQDYGGCDAPLGGAAAAAGGMVDGTTTTIAAAAATAGGGGGLLGGPWVQHCGKKHAVQNTGGAPRTGAALFLSGCSGEPQSALSHVGTGQHRSGASLWGGSVDVAEGAQEEEEYAAALLDAALPDVKTPVMAAAGPVWVAAARMPPHSPTESAGHRAGGTAQLRVHPHVETRGPADADFGGTFEYRWRRPTTDGVQGIPAASGAAAGGSRWACNSGGFAARIARGSPPFSPPRGLHGDRGTRGERPLLASPPANGATSCSGSGGGMRGLASMAGSGERATSSTWYAQAPSSQRGGAPGGLFASGGDVESLEHSGISDDLEDSRATVRPPTGWRSGVHPPPLLSAPHPHRAAVSPAAVGAAALLRIGSSAARSDGASGHVLASAASGLTEGSAGCGRGHGLLRGAAITRISSSVCTLSLGRLHSASHNLDEPDVWRDETYAEPTCLRGDGGRRG